MVYLRWWSSVAPPLSSLSPVAQVLLVLFSVFFSCFASHPTTAAHHAPSTHFFPLTLSCLLLAIVSPSPLSKQSKWRHCVVCVRACVCDISFLREDEPCTARTFTQRITNTHPHKESQILTHTTRAHTYTQTQTYTRTQTLSSQQ